MLLLFALVDGKYVGAGAGAAVLMLLVCRCSYTGLLCHLYTNSEPFLNTMRPIPSPDPLVLPPMGEGEREGEDTSDTNV